MITPFCHRIAGALLCAAATLPAAAASFDCAKASTEVDKAICADASLSSLDDKLALAYRDAMAATGGLIKNSQREWAKSRADCERKPQTTQCLVDEYKMRVEVLSTVSAAVRNPERRLRLDNKKGPYRIEAVLFNPGSQGEALVYISRMGEHKAPQVLQTYLAAADSAVRVEDYNQDGIMDIALHNGPFLNSWEYYLGTKAGTFVLNEALTKLEDDATDGLELFEHGEIHVAHHEGPDNTFLAIYKMVGDKPVIQSKETTDGHSDNKRIFTTYETYRDGKLVKSTTQAMRR